MERFLLNLKVQSVSVKLPNDLNGVITSTFSISGSSGYHKTSNGNGHGCVDEQNLLEVCEQD